MVDDDNSNKTSTDYPTVHPLSKGDIFIRQFKPKLSLPVCREQHSLTSQLVGIAGVATNIFEAGGGMSYCPT